MKKILIVLGGLLLSSLLASLGVSNNIYYIVIVFVVSLAGLIMFYRMYQKYLKKEKTKEKFLLFRSKLFSKYSSSKNIEEAFNLSIDELKDSPYESITYEEFLNTDTSQDELLGALGKALYSQIVKGKNINQDDINRMSESELKKDSVDIFSSIYLVLTTNIVIFFFSLIFGEAYLHKSLISESIYAIYLIIYLFSMLIYLYKYEQGGIKNESQENI